MRRKEYEITDRAEIDSIIHKSSVCRIALSEGDQPYIIPLCFGYTNNTLYFHTGYSGKKIDILKENNKACFEFDINEGIMRAEKACKWGVKYKSVIGFGKISFINDTDAKHRALNIIMKQYSREPSTFPEEILNITAILKLEIENITGKKSSHEL